MHELGFRLALSVRIKGLSGAIRPSDMPRLIYRSGVSGRVYMDRRAVACASRVRSGWFLCEHARVFPCLI